MEPQSPEVPERQVVEAARALAKRAGAGDVVRIERIEGGRNNRAFRLDTRERSFFLKVYHADTADPRPRLQTEVAFLRFAWRHDIRVVPEPVTADPDNNLGLYGFVDGRRLPSAEVRRDHIDQAARFLGELNRHRNTSVATTLPTASEACFAFRQHLQLIDDRVRRLQSIENSGAAETEASALVREQLTPLWEEVARRARGRAATEGILDEPELEPAGRCLSPSDFGFHNVIENATGQLIFHDFEYAGWDDPAKLVCDFLCQPEVPVAEGDAAFAIDRLLAATDARVHRRRVELLHPVYLMKWCCICLNDFLPAAGRRRNFADAGSSAERKQSQLAKVRSLMERLRRM